jgi:thiamine-phosphate diphosphorylase/hydroxyethylthiazole kinase
MSPNGDEANDLATFKGGLLINMGTLTNESVSQYMKAIIAYNRSSTPIVFDPVGAGATDIRIQAVKELMEKGYFHLIKGNEAEIRQVYGADVTRQRGVDSGSSTLTRKEKADLVKELAFREGELVRTVICAGSVMLSDLNLYPMYRQATSFCLQAKLTI